jgi:hypothetical protein
MKKLIGLITLAAASAGIFALPASAHDRDDRGNNSRVVYAQPYSVYTQRYEHQDRRDRDYRHVRDVRGEYTYGRR